MLHHSLSALLDVTTALAVLETSSRFMLTLGVGLFLAYLICMLGANLLAMAHRYSTRLSAPQSADTPDAVVVKQEA